MRLLVATCGFCLIGFAAGSVVLGLKTGACIAIGILGIGLIADATFTKRSAKHE